jgi:hypothetical protein
MMTTEALALRIALDNRSVASLKLGTSQLSSKPTHRRLAPDAGRCGEFFVLIKTAFLQFIIKENEAFKFFPFRRCIF